MATALDLDTFLITVYCAVDDLYLDRFAPLKPAGPGAAPALSDSEVLTIVLLAQAQTKNSERRFVRYVRDHWRPYFPGMLSQSAFNRRARDLMPVLGALGPAIAELVIGRWQGVGYEILDGVPVPLMRRHRGLRRKLFGCAEAGLGRGGSDRDWYYGVELLGAAHPAGVFTGFVVGPADTAERWLAEALLRWRADPAAPQPTAAQLAPILGPTHARGGARQGPTGPIRGRAGVGRPARAAYLADLGLRGRRWQAHWRAAYAAAVVTKADVPAAATPAQRRGLRRLVCRHRQLVETAFGRLTDTFGLVFPRARTMQGLLTRLGAKLAAFNLGVYLNYLLGREPFAFLNPLDL